MGHMLTIFKKELIDTLRDRRTIIAMVVLPLLLFPLIIVITTKVSQSQAEKAKAETLKVAVISEDRLPDFTDLFAVREDIELIENVHEDSVRAFIRNDSLDGAFVFSPRFRERIEAMRPGRVKFYFRSTEDFDIKKDRILEVLEEFKDDLLSERFRKLDLDQDIAEAVNLVEVDIATAQERIGKAVGGFLPYIFVIFCFVGSMYPAIDLAAGEKERGTIETLLTAPVNRFEILLGKFGVVVVAGVSSALISILGLYLGVRMTNEIPDEIMDVILNILEPQSIALLMSLLLPLTIFFAGLLLTLSIFAKSFKEAQSLITPFNIFVIIPVAVGLIPGVELNTTTALIPILNVSLATKEIIAGTIDTGLLIEVYGSLIALALLSLFVSSKIFTRESVIFRG